MKLYLGCGPSPLHEQHRKIMENPDEWTFVDFYVKEPHIKNWDAAKLDEVKDGSVETIYSSHLCEHFPHIDLQKILLQWYSKLKKGGTLILNVPDLAWAATQILKYNNGQPLDGYFYDFSGEHGLLSVVYGSESHEGEFHKSGFVKAYLETLLKDVGFSDVLVKNSFDAHDMGVLLATAIK